MCEYNCVWKARRTRSAIGFQKQSDRTTTKIANLQNDLRVASGIPASGASAAAFACCARAGVACGSAAPLLSQNRPKSAAEVRAEQILGALENQEQQVLKLQGTRKNLKIRGRRSADKDW